MLPREDNSVIVYEFPVENVNAPPVLVQLQAEIKICIGGCVSAVGDMVVWVILIFAYWLPFASFT